MNLTSYANINHGAKPFQVDGNFKIFKSYPFLKKVNINLGF